MPSILIIDDDVTLLTRLSIQLELADFEVINSSDLVYGEQLFHKHKPDLVMIEVRSGNEAGWDVLERLAGRTQVVVLSAASREEDVVRAFTLGAVDYVSKPYRSAELVARLRARVAAVPKKTRSVGMATPGTVEPAQALAPGATGNMSSGASAAARSVVTPPPPVVEPVSVALPKPEPSMTSPAASVAPTPAQPAGATGSVRPTAVATPPVAPGPQRTPPDEDRVFMTEAEEMAMLRMPPAASGGSKTILAPDLDEHAGIGARLRHERQRRHLTLVQIENELKIRMSYLQAIEDEKFTLLPRGPAALQMFRSYLSYLGLETPEIMDEFRRLHYVEISEPPPALGGIAMPRMISRRSIVILAILLALVVGLTLIFVFDPGFFTRLPEFFVYLWQELVALWPGGT
ncbi:response regulator [Candidatus Chloroploca sp. M-50]|uniref:Response regulator n=1 Tax=Candidatus Chloroploca mongolica TaxID=2528176 RepID=A0ABS4D6Y4_9CHLR|nr:response regulator [Candidatus Chloroploca mongolica]MBP1465192.1 response regulator [Candidatus Chloroploca mongolica]